jgi:hypothetical protein
VVGPVRESFDPQAVEHRGIGRQVEQFGGDSAVQVVAQLGAVGAGAEQVVNAAEVTAGHDEARVAAGEDAARVAHALDAVHPKLQTFPLDLGILMPEQAHRLTDTPHRSHFPTSPRQTMRPGTTIAGRGSCTGAWSGEHRPPVDPSPDGRAPDPERGPDQSAHRSAQHAWRRRRGRRA